MYSKEKNFYTVVVITCFLLALILVYFFNSIIKYHKRDLKDKLEVIYGKNGVLEEEKKRIGREIHDGVSSTLAGMKLMIESVHGLAEKDKNRLHTISVNLNSSLTNLRYIMNDLMEINLKTKTLAGVIIEYIDRINASGLDGHMKIEYDFNGDMRFLHDKSLHIYRIFQEVISNAQKHSNASLLKIQVCEFESVVEITFKDDGDGFDTSQMMLSNSGIGLNNIIFRTEIVEGLHSIHSEKNIGTEIKLKIPK